MVRSRVFATLARTAGQRTAYRQSRSSYLTGLLCLQQPNIWVLSDLLKRPSADERNPSPTILQHQNTGCYVRRRQTITSVPAIGWPK